MQTGIRRALAVVMVLIGVSPSFADSLMAMFPVSSGTQGASSSPVSEVKTWNDGYVPAPKPAVSKVTLGAYIFPGWYRDKGRGDYPYRTHDEDSEWKNCVAKQPGPRPLLGFYDDSLPEVNDWHIKWALEHGISYFAFDWYWNAGEKRLARSLERGFLKAKYSGMMKFCIHWCNHGLDWKQDGKPARLDFSGKALTEMAEYLADNYFKLPNYLTIDGRPVLMVFVSGALIEANGGSAGFRSALGEMNRILRSKGIKDIYLVSLAAAFPKAGFDAFTAYSYYGTDMDSKYEWKRGYSMPYDEMVTHFETMWKSATRARNSQPYIVPIGSNWDDRPRARDHAVVIAGKTPDKFETMCRASLKYIDKRTNMAIIEAWNEWGEGSYIEPDQEFNFEFLDRVRRVFTDSPASHVDLVPDQAKIKDFSVLSEAEVAQAKELEKRPYPTPPLGMRTTRVDVDKPLPMKDTLKKWEFDSGSNEGWFPYEMDKPTVSNGALKTTATGADPQLTTLNVNVDVQHIQCVALRLKWKTSADSNGSGCQMYWSTKREPGLSGGKSFAFGLEGDGGWHTYQISMKPEGKWSGTLDKLRFDIGVVGDEVEIDWIRIYSREAASEGSLLLGPLTKSPLPQGLTVLTNASEATYTSPWLRASFSLREPVMTFLSVDATGAGRHERNLLKGPVGGGPVVSAPSAASSASRTRGAVAMTGNVLRYADVKLGDWKEWNGAPCGYEGLLVDAYYPLTALITGRLGRGVPIP